MQLLVLPVPMSTFEPEISQTRDKNIPRFFEQRVLLQQTVHLRAISERITVGCYRFLFGQRLNLDRKTKYDSTHVPL